MSSACIPLRAMPVLYEYQGIPLGVSPPLLVLESFVKEACLKPRQ